MKIKILLFFVFVLVFSGAALGDDFPKIDINGYKRWTYKNLKVDPQVNYFSGITQLGGYAPNLSGTPLQEELQLGIIGELSDKLSVSYDISQQPETPDKYDVKVSYDKKHELTFGDLYASFSGNEFATVNKYMNGVLLHSKDDGYEFTFVPSTKVKSQVQQLTTQKGNNTKGPFSLGHGSIMENTERIEINSVTVVRGRDYIIDYFEGKVTFNRILTENDEIKYSYEYTTLMDIFFPSLANKDFMGVQGRVTFDPSNIGFSSPKLQPIIKDDNVVFPALPQTTLATLEMQGSQEVKITLPTAESSLADIKMFEDSPGKYSLKKFPVVPFSEILTYKGVKLVKAEDYTIKYDTGKIILLTADFPDSGDPLTINYKYYVTATSEDNVTGKGGAGPYNLVNTNIVPESETILLNGILLLPNVDYTLDYVKGKILFNRPVSNTSTIIAKYTYEQMVAPVLPPPEFPKSLTLGATYLKETAKKSSGAPTQDNVESFTGQVINSNNQTIYLTKFPVLTTSEGGTISVTINGRPATAEIDYTVPTVEVDPSTGQAIVIPPTRLAFLNDKLDTSNGYYTGTIKMLTSVEAASVVTVVYTFKKSTVGRYSGFGNGSRGPYYLRNFVNVVPGSELVQVWTSGSQVQDTYTRNNSFEGNAGDMGYSINYTKDSAYILFNKELPTTKNFSAIFQYIIPQSTSQLTSDLVKDLTGVDASFKIGNVLQVEGNYARSSNDQVFTAIATTESFNNFSSPTNRLVLSNKPLIENSEKVNVNNYVVNKDIDYFIDYTAGTINFYYVTLTSRDAVTVDYQFQSAQGIQVGGGKQADSAYKYSIKSTIGKISASYNKKNIGFDFSPLGGTAIGVGSNYQDFSIYLQPTVQDFQSSFTYLETNNPINNSRSAFSRNYDRNYNVGVKPMGIANIAFNFRNQVLSGDPLVVSGPKTTDSLLNSYTLSLTPSTFQKGVLVFNQRYGAQKTDTEDRIARSKSKIESAQVGYSLGLTERIKANADYQLSEPKTTLNVTSETTTSWNISRDFSYDLSLDLTFPKIKKFTTYAKVINHNGLVFVPTPETLNQTINTTYHVELAPIDMLNATYDKTRSEVLTVLVNGKNPRNDRNATNIKLMPHPAISANWGYSEDFTVHETALESSGRTNTYVADWMPISLEKVKLNLNYNLFDSFARTPSGTIETINHTDTFDQTYKLTFTPLPILSITPGIIQQDYLFQANTSPDDLKARNQTVNCVAFFKPMEQLSFDFNYNLKVTTRLSDNINRHKGNISLKTGYKAFSWGDLIYSIEEENNQGEIQAGGTMPNLNYLKTTNTLSLNFNIPQDNPVISSIVVTASFKMTKYQDRLTPANSLLASLFSIDGALNF